MAANPFDNQRNITLEKNKVITVTSRTVRFAKTVYQTRNIAGFSEGEVEIGNIPRTIIIGFFVLGLPLYSYEQFWGWVFFLAAIGGVIWNFVKPKHYGFLLTLNSGEHKLFTTVDKAGLAQVISTIYDFIETEKDATYQISIKNSQVQGNFIQGDTDGPVTFTSKQ